MKKTISLILAIVLSMSIFVSNITGIAMIVRAEENVEGGEGTNEDSGTRWEDEEASGEPSDTGWEADESERARQEAYERAAKEAEEAARQASDEEVSREAQRQAEEQAERIRQEAEKAERAAEEARRAEEDSKYSLVASLGSNNDVRRLDFGSASIGEQRDYMPLDITNTGNQAVDLIYSKTNDGGAFSLTLHGDRTHLEPGESSRFNVSMGENLSAGTYSCVVSFADSNRDPAFLRALNITVSGVVTGRAAQVTDITISPGRATVAVGSNFQFTANVTGKGNYDNGVRWSVSGNRSAGTGISSSGLLSVASDETSGTINVIATSVEDGSVYRSLTVSLQRNSVNVNVSVSPSNGGVVYGGGAVSQGGSVTLSAAPAKNYYFTGWVVNGKTVSTAANYTISNLQSNVDVTAKFAQRYVTVTAVANNTNAGNVVGGGNVSFGGSTTISAKAYNGYVFTGWKEGDSIVSRDASIKLNNLTVDRKFTAIFEQTTHTLTLAANPGEGGSVTGGGTFDLGKGTTIKASAAKGYTFQGWQVNGQYVSYTSEYKIDRIDRDFTCTAIFMKNTAVSYEISSGVATTGGSITPGGKVLVEQGKNATYTITPKPGFAILAVAVDGVQVGAVSTYTFTNVQGSHTISAAFVQTDAGKAANQSSGKPVQTQKVEALPKTTANTATAQSTVDLSEAASGEGGDEFVEEMDLTDIAVPTDAELGISYTPESEAYSEVTQMLGMTLDEVSTMIATGNTMPILDAAFYTGGLGAYAQNAYEPRGMVSLDYQNMSRDELMQVSDDYINPSLPNLDTVVQQMLTTDDVMKLARGGHVDIAVSLTAQEQTDVVTERVMENAVGQKPVQYFDLTMLKSVDGYTERVTELPASMEVVIQIPDAVYSSGKTYSVLRVHNGQVTVLPDLDNDPKTITFRTDKFSSYAIAREVASARELVTWLIAGAALAFGVAATCFLILIVHQRKVRRAKRRSNR